MFDTFWTTFETLLKLWLELFWNVFEAVSDMFGTCLQGVIHVSNLLLTFVEICLFVETAWDHFEIFWNCLSRFETLLKLFETVYGFVLLVVQCWDLLWTSVTCCYFLWLVGTGCNVLRSFETFCNLLWWFGFYGVFLRFWIDVTSQTIGPCGPRGRGPRCPVTVCVCYCASTLWNPIRTL